MLGLRPAVRTFAAIAICSQCVPTTIMVALQNRSDVAAVMAAAEEGDADAQYKLGWMYSLGTDAPKDHEKSAQWYGRAAEQGHSGAQVLLGINYEVGGLGVPQDYSKALYWYRRAAEQGDASGQFSLGNLYLQGRGVRQDDEKAVQWFRRVAEIEPDVSTDEDETQWVQLVAGQDQSQ